MSVKPSGHGAPLPESGGRGSLRSVGGRDTRPGVAMTRPDETGRFTRLLQAGGFRALPFPLTKIVPPESPLALDTAVRGLARPEEERPFDVLLLTSKRAIPPVVERLEKAGLRPPFALPGTEVWVVGQATGDAAREAGLAPHRMPDTFEAEALLDEAAGWRRLEGLRILFPRAETGRDLLPEGLRARGARVTLVTAYRILPDQARARDLVAGVRSGMIDAVPLTAGSAARVLADAWTIGEVPTGQGSEWPAAVPIVVIGPATGAVAERRELPIAGIAEPHTLKGVVQALRTLLHR